ncbi:hypothetical protein EJ419_00825 [Alloscardovia theropitheci]|uniref:Uncharacterized protein n=1 Tax=Alloscardovia theropitheci TaxID=2496842 RepID=A0A4R0QWX0_9BIFI|nr:hypothetical protein [Alloscardovia theropitheci]TCD54967.1 hypothetical protein EJ419_00825 [Alloscardovia theropitheci]
MSDNKGYAPELIELHKQLLEHVYVQGLQSIYDRVEKKFNKDAHKRAQQAKGDINSDKKQMDSAIVGESSQAIRDSIDKHVTQYDSIGEK